MPDLLTRVARIHGDLDDAGVGHALVGGIAVGIHAEARFTKDVDVAVAVGDDAAAEALVRRLQTAGYRILSVLEHRSQRLATVRMTAPGSGSATPELDLLFASSGVEDRIVAQAVSLAGEAPPTMPVARPGHLVALKVLSMSPARPMDRADVLALLRVATSAERQAARDLVEEIVLRGFHRGRDLRANLEDLLAARG